MKILNLAAGAILLAGASISFSQSAVSCGQTLDVPLRPGAILTMTSLSADIEIVGKEQEAMRVSCRADDSDSASHIELRASGTPTRAQLAITGAGVKHNHLAIRVEVPRNINLRLRMSAGEVKVDEVIGNKDISLVAGNIAISSIKAWDYRDIGASVRIGQVNALPYGTEKGGIFRVFRKRNTKGEYRLHAHVTTGGIDLLVTDPRAAPGSK